MTLSMFLIFFLKSNSLFITLIHSKERLRKSKLFKNTVRKDSRSIMNVCFRTGSEELDAKFVEESKKANIVSIKGHRLVGGMRASIYNAMPIEGVKALVEFMAKFEKENLK